MSLFFPTFSLEILFEAAGDFDISVLALFVATGQQDEDLLATSEIVHAISGIVVHSETPAPTGLLSPGFPAASRSILP